MTTPRLASLLSLAALAACGTPAEVLDELAIRDLPDDARITGVDIDSDGSLVVSTDFDGLYRVASDGTFTRILSSDALWEAGFGAEVTDVAALGDGRYAFVQPGFGVLYDTSDASLTMHFCYEPGFFGDWEVQYQETHSLAFDPTTNRLLSQPQTFTEGTVDRADVAEFDVETGEELVFHELADRQTNAGALAVTPDGILLAEGATLFEYALGSATPSKRTSLRSLGIDRIEGLTYDSARDALIVVDGDRLVWVANY
jgi:hypothetical protein